ncbi:24911_t:CDS:2 [Entrophospora sp. SA101]|nr:24911_t:CDS:2 [Entrophospora sp. SA101]
MNKVNMIGTKELIERTVKSVKKKDKELIIKEALNNGEEIAIKNFFTIKRQTPKTKGSKRCDKHEREIESFRRANKGKGIQAYAKSEIFKKLFNGRTLAFQANNGDIDGVIEGIKAGTITPCDKKKKIRMNNDLTKQEIFQKLGEGIKKLVVKNKDLSDQPFAI